MRFRHEMAYDAGADRVYAMKADRRFREEVCRHQQVLRYRVDLEDTASGLSVDIDQVQALRGVATSVRRFVGEEIEIEQRETWHSPGDATLVVSIPGKPGRMDGRISLREQDGRTVETVTGDIRVKVPLVGRQIEEMVARVFRYALDAEYAVGTDWLEDD
ncbi:MAG TPA: DUF2505 domain-containing protein [Nocardioides sp.]|uniref:DUF2505 domain-containing protein n=1 Tax=Nocardioides sp. TaxID=35761 RepID=UPI002C3B42B1|nr:DUF2505 domain-containing protein [Nocardioides sp.]HQR26152.1 DUF2505 domain-containing protein [Nocardioides sp.]